MSWDNTSSLDFLWKNLVMFYEDSFSPNQIIHYFDSVMNLADSIVMIGNSIDGFYDFGNDCSIFESIR